MMKGIIVAGTQSGVGKTTVTLAILKALLDAGYKVQPYKVGPDFIDPSHLEQLAALPCYNLDSFMMGADGINRELAKSSADFAIIEGAMGLYDGDSSCAQIAHIAAVPVLLVIDANASSESVAAVALGFVKYAHYTPYNIGIAGVIANKVGSEKHANAIKTSLEKVGVRLVGFIPKDLTAIPSRHLGLHMGTETTLSDQALKSIYSNLDMQLIINLSAEVNVKNRVEAEKNTEKKTKSITIGIPLDAAFCFYYRSNIEALQNDARIIHFSALSERLPDVDGLYIGGGYPELYARELASNKPLLREIRRRSADGMPIYGECGGLMYLSRSLTTNDNNTFRFVDALPAEIRMTKGRQALGHSEVEAIRDCVIALKGDRFRGHEYHYSIADVDDDATFAYKMVAGVGINGFDGITEYNILASYHHAHVYSMPNGFDVFIRKIEEYSKS
jgi:cobyrinic acid a,c-diamide synthase